MGDIVRFQIQSNASFPNQQKNCPCEGQSGESGRQLYLLGFDGLAKSYGGRMALAFRGWRGATTGKATAGVIGLV